MGCLRAVPRMVAVALLGATLGACAAADTASDAEAIRATRERSLAAFNAGDIEKFMAEWPAEDVVVLAPGAPPIVGKAAFRSFLEQMFATSLIAESLHVEEQVIAGDWAFERFATFGTVVPRSGGDTVRMRGKAIDIYRRQADGSWKVARSVLNYNQ